MSPGNDYDRLVGEAGALVAKLRDHALVLVCAESCTGGLLSALITEIPGSSEVFDRGFVTYSNAAKVEMLGVPEALIERHGAVSAEVAMKMAKGALERSGAGIAVSITGIAGPGGGTAAKPVGLVQFAGLRDTKSGTEPAHLLLERRFGDIGRVEIRLQAVAAALDIINGLTDDLI